MEVVLDKDIAAAPDAMSLARITAQNSRNLQEKQATLAFENLATINGQIASDEASVAADELLEFRKSVILAIADKYMTTSTATDPQIVALDAQKDAARLRAAVDEVMKLL